MQSCRHEVKQNKIKMEIFYPSPPDREAAWAAGSAEQGQGRRMEFGDVGLPHSILCGENSPADAPGCSFPAVRTRGAQRGDLGTPPEHPGQHQHLRGQHQQPPFSAQGRSEPGPCAGCVTTPLGPSSPQDCKPAAKAPRQPRAPGSSSRPPAQLGPRSSDARSSRPAGAQLEPRSPRLEPQGPRQRRGSSRR